MQNAANLPLATPARARAATLAAILALTGNPEPQRIAGVLLEKFGTVGAVMAARPAALARLGVAAGEQAAFRATRELAVELAKEEIGTRPVLNNLDKVIGYLRAEIGHDAIESLHVLFLDKKNALIAAEEHSRGTVDHAPVYVREVIKRALELDASAMIFAHNHPSGDPTPSRADLEMTRELQKGAAALGLAVHDHVIVTRSTHASLRALGLI